MSNNAPVCLIQPVIDTQQPDPVPLPSIPVATDLMSALAAINTMATILRHITGQTPTATRAAHGQGNSGGNGFKTKKSQPKPKQGRFEEQLPKRKTNIITVHSSQDPTTTLTFKRIDGVLFKDSKTGELWSWKR